MYGRVNIGIVYALTSAGLTCLPLTEAVCWLKNKQGPKVGPCTRLLRFYTT